MEPKDDKQVLVYVAGIRRTVFINAWLANGFDKKAAAIEAGFPERNAASMGAMMFKTPEVQEVLAAARKYLTDKANVSAETVAVELEMACQFARECRNPGALVSAIGKKMQLYGLEAPKKIDIADVTPQPSVQKESLADMILQLDEMHNASIH